MRTKITIKQKLLRGATMESLVEEGHLASSIRKAMHEIENEHTTAKLGRKKRNVMASRPDLKFKHGTASTDEQYAMLAVAIVTTAVRDLARCYVQEARQKKSGKHVPYASKSIEKWLIEDAPMLTSVPPEVLIQAAKQQAERGLTTSHAPHRFQQVQRDPYVTKKDYRRKEIKSNG